MRAVLTDGSPDALIITVRLLRWFYMWLTLASILGWAHRALSRPFRWLPYANGAVYPWYVFHQSLIIAIAFALSSLRLGPVLEPVLVIAGTIAGCALLHHFVVRRAGYVPKSDRSSGLTRRREAGPAKAPVEAG